jgi:hypothetical protein
LRRTGSFTGRLPKASFTIDLGEAPKLERQRSVDVSNMSKADCEELSLKTSHHHRDFFRQFGVNRNSVWRTPIIWKKSPGDFFEKNRRAIFSDMVWCTRFFWKKSPSDFIQKNRRAIFSTTHGSTGTKHYPGNIPANINFSIIS